jgi:DNA-binding transcriptional regulator YiaG
MKPQTTFAACGNPFIFGFTPTNRTKGRLGNMQPFLSVAQVKQIREARAGGMRYKELTSIFHVSRETLARAAAGRGTYEGF